MRSLGFYYADGEKDDADGHAGGEGGYFGQQNYNHCCLLELDLLSHSRLSGSIFSKVSTAARKFSYVPKRLTDCLSKSSRPKS